MHRAASGYILHGYEAFLHTKHMKQHRKTIKESRPNKDPSSTHKKAETTRTSHDRLRKWKQMNVEKENHKMAKNVVKTMTSKRVARDSTPKRFSRSPYHPYQKRVRKQIETQNLKIYRMICEIATTVPNREELDQRWQKQQEMKSLTFYSYLLVCTLSMFLFPTNRRLHHPSQIEMDKNIKLSQIDRPLTPFSVYRRPTSKHKSTISPKSCKKKLKNNQKLSTSQSPYKKTMRKTTSTEIIR
ncbi:hypothetical protein RFI_10085 [Reticulomyxa filosa]|uniref:Uncharacterized protein n=1 Tax=Reticulomyxa filosa TaxID=46433 RepID=X6NMX6_RETFI|nr:hypothetical protein RFI_10085 [Reticulomyxa filosa]|eukprot:ETO27049.1 hypothetical protein RFI_10085 [Reticulomyxa filosa]